MKIAALLAGAFALACLCMPDPSLSDCLERHSFDTCHHAMVR